MKGCPKGRSWIKKGEKCSVPKLLKTRQVVAKHALLMVEDVNLIRKLRFEQRYTLQRLSKEFTMSVSCIQQICAGKTWKVRQK
jgi:hypothetical protein